MEMFFAVSGIIAWIIFIKRLWNCWRGFYRRLKWAFNPNREPQRLRTPYREFVHKAHRP